MQNVTVSERQGVERAGPANSRSPLSLQSAAGDKVVELNLLPTCQTGFALADLDLQMAMEVIWEGATTTAVCWKESD